MEPTQLLCGIVSPQRRRELAAAMLKRVARSAELAPPSRHSTIIDGRTAWVYNAGAIAEICRWMLRASDEELDLISQLDDGNAVMNSSVFHLEDSLTH